LDIDVMATLRTPLEVALGFTLDLDFEDLDLGDYDAADARDAETEADLLDGAIQTGEFLYRESIRKSVPGLAHASR
jgi:hypothetical protein